MVWVTIWILLSAWLFAAGWILSACHALNGPGYLILLAITVAGGLVFKKHWWPPDGFHPPNWRKLRRRFLRPAPLLILAIAVLSLAAALCSPPENGDSNAYRLPRVLHWLAESRWHWIRTDDSRQNIAGCGYPWLFAPLILLTQTDRWICLPNFISYLLLPVALFSFFRRMKVESRVAWWWSWLVSAGWCYALQAYSTDDDSLATIYALAALDFGLRAREEKKIGWLWLSLLAASVLTAVKPTNLPLLLPCFIAICPSWRLALNRPQATAAVILFCVLASFLPLAFLNWRHTGSWKGYMPAPGPVIWWQWGRAQDLPSPFWGFIGNAFCLPVQNLLPPFFPWAPAWNGAMKHFLQTPLGSHFIAFENFGKLSRSITPVSAGLGLNVILVMLASIFCPRKSRAASRSASRPAIYGWLRWTPWLALFVFMAKVGSYQNARFLAPYYPLLLLALLLHPGMAGLVRRRWWQRLVLLVMAGTLAFLFYPCGRGFVPSSLFARLHASSHPVKVLDDYYQTRLSIATYWDFAARHAAGEPVIGYASVCGGLEPGLWRPWNHHGRVERILPDDSPAWVRSRGIRSVIIDDAALGVNHETIEQWLARFQATLADQMTFSTDPGAPRTHLYFARLNSTAEPASPVPAPLQPPP